MTKPTRIHRWTSGQGEGVVYVDGSGGAKVRAPGTTAQYLRGDLTWATPAGGGGGLADGDYGDITVGGTGTTMTIDADVVTNAKAANMAANTVKANATAGTADPADLAVSTNTVVGRVAGNIVAAQLATGQIANDAVTFAKMQNVTGPCLIGKSGVGAGDAETITSGGDGVYQIIGGNVAVTSVPGSQMDTFGSGAAGAVPASGGGTTNFLRADGTWNAPAGGGGPSNVDGGTPSDPMGGGLDPVDGGIP